MNHIVHPVPALLLVLVSAGLAALAACAPGASPGEDPSLSPPPGDGGAPAIIVVTDPGSLDAGSPDPEAASVTGPDDGGAEDAAPEASSPVEAATLGGEAGEESEAGEAGLAPAVVDAGQGFADSAPPPACPPPETSCAGRCVDTSGDVANCGQCGSVCAYPAVGGAHAVCSAGSCASACDPGDVVCGGACVDPTSDPDNCGACGRACAPGTCSGGTCQPWAVVENADDWNIACDGTSLTWSAYDSSQVLQAAADGGQVVQESAWSILAGANQGQVSAIVAAGGVTLWTGTDPSGGTQALFESYAPRTAGYPIVSNLDPTLGLAVDANAANAYFATATSGQASIWQCDIAGSSPTCVTLATIASPQIGAVAVDEQAVYWTDPASGLVSRYVFADGAVSTVADGQRGVDLLAVDADRVYFTSKVGTQTALSARVKATGATAVLATSDAITALAVDGTTAYFADGVGVESVPAVGGPVATLATNPPGLTTNQIVYASGSIYLHDSGGGTVRGLRVR